MISIIGEYYCKLDAKGRFLLPSGMMKQLPEDQQAEFVMNRGMDKCLVLYPKTVWEDELKQIQSKNQYVAKNRAFTRMFLNGATPMEPDKNGRILIPKRLATHATLAKEIVLIGQIDKVEIWDKEVYESWLEEPGFDFEQLAEEVMGNEDDE